MIRCVCLIAVMSMMTLSAANLTKSVKFNQNGSFRIGNIDFEMVAYSLNWKNSSNKTWTQVNTQKNKERLAVTGIMQLSNYQASVTENITATGADSFQVEFHTKFDEPTPLNSLVFSITTPASAKSITVDGKEIAFPTEFTKNVCYSNNHAKSIVFAAGDGTEVEVSGDPLKVVLHDNRKVSKTNQETFTIRLGATPSSGEITEASIVLNFKVTPLKLQQVDLSKSANVGFVDEVEGDGKGGCTDQGPENDLRMLNPGKISLGAHEFEVLDADKNQGRSAIILSGEKRAFTGSTATLELPENQASAVNLLHAVAWPGAKAIGSIIAVYPDGYTTRIPVSCHVDCNNWANPIAAPNAAIAWQDDNPTGQVGLYASSFALEKAGPTALRFELESPVAIWIIAGVTLSNHRFSPATAADNKPLITQANQQWKELDYKRIKTQGSALDFSFLADAPAGKYGFIRPTTSGHLSFTQAPDKTIRLYGVNLCQSANYLSKEKADQLADYFKYCGYNTVRFHHHDGPLVDPEAPDSVTLSASQLDKIEYLFSRMKQNGIYVTTDLYTSRKYKPGDSIPCTKPIEMSPKAMVPISQVAMDNWKAFARNWMTHQNPYTGLAWKDDPALYCINLINEEPLTRIWSTSSESAKLYTDRFQQYCKEHNLPESKAMNSNAVFRKFLHELQSATLDEQINFVKHELGIKAMVTSLNCGADIPLTLLRNKFDLVDNHGYFDHPAFPEKKWSLPSSYGQLSPIRRLAVLPRYIMPTRIVGKPFIVTEFNYVNPNIYRAVAGPMIGAYASLQNWDALYRFAWSHGERKINELCPAGGFDAACDPLAQLSDRIAIAMYRREDVESAKETYAYPVPADCFDKGILGGYSATFSNLGLITGVGTIPDDVKSLPTGATRLIADNASNPEALKDAEIAKLWKQTLDQKQAVSSTGQIRLDAKTNTFTVTTARTESITLESGSLTAGCLSVKNASCFQTIAAISLDGKGISESNSILVIQLTNLSNTGDYYENNSRRLLKKTGKLPLLIQKGTAVVEITTDKPFKVTALNSDGASVGTVTTEHANGVIRFTADNTLFHGGVMAYHLTR